MIFMSKYLDLYNEVVERLSKEPELQVNQWPLRMCHRQKNVYLKMVILRDLE